MPRRLQGEYIDWYVDNGMREHFEVWLDGRLFKVIEPNNFISKNFGDSFFPRFGQKQHTLQIRTPSSASALEEYSFTYPYDENDKSLVYRILPTSQKCQFIYNIGNATKCYYLVEATYGVGTSYLTTIMDHFLKQQRLVSVRVVDTIPAKLCNLVHSSGVYWSTNNVPITAYSDSSYPIAHHFLLLRGSGEDVPLRPDYGFRHIG